MNTIRTLSFAALLTELALAGVGETKTLVVLHTNDLHGHLRPGYESLGGMPYISGYVKKVRQERNDVLLLDAGDVTEKGDMLSFATHDAVLYEAMDHIRYDAAVFGNHDFNKSVYLEEGLKAAPHVPFLCLNYVPKAKGPRYQASKIFTVNGVRVGVTGLTLENEDYTLNREACLARLAQEQQRLEKETDVQVVLCHEGSKVCQTIAKALPGVDLFVSGHTHELLDKGIRTDSGALIVQTGDYALHVGRVELTVDTTSHKVLSAEASLVPMDHANVPCDDEMVAKTKKREQALCPEASRVVARSDERLSRTQVGRLSAAALRKAAKTDVGFCHPGRIIRSGLPKGNIDVNALFLTGGSRGYEIVTATLTGKAIDSYFRRLIEKRNEQTAWDGFEAKIHYDKSAERWNVTSSLEPDRTYTVAMPAAEWKERFLTGKQDKNAAGTRAEPCAFHFTDALAAYVEANVPKDATLDASVRAMPKNGSEIKVKQPSPTPARL